MLSQRGLAIVTTANRAEVRRWLGSQGVAAPVYGALSNSQLATIYNDVSDSELQRWTQCTGRRCYLEVPYADRAHVKANGCKWDKTSSKWYYYEGYDHRGALDAYPVADPDAYPVADPFEPGSRSFRADFRPAPDVKQDKPEPARAIADAVMGALAGLDLSGGDALTKADVLELIERHARYTVVIETRTPREPRDLPNAPRHEVFPRVLSAVAAGKQVALVGPAGSGKTTLAAQVADALALPFRFTGAIASEYKLSGFVDAQGRIVSTPFREAYETGGVFLFDEIDGSLPGAVLAFNAALANGHADFPDGMVRRHEDFRVVAAANTYGHGADRIYVGRNQLDGSTLDRFVFIAMDYDETLERAMVGDRDTYEWTDRVQAVRRASRALKLRHIVSPRATMDGLDLLGCDGWTRGQVEAATIFKALDPEVIAKLEAEVAS